MKRVSIFLIFSCFPALLCAQNLQWSATQGPYSTTVYAFDTSGGYIYAGTTIGLFRRAVTSAIWTAVPTAIGLINTVISHDSIIFIGGAGGCRISNDRGVTWVTSDTGFSFAPFVYTLKYAKGILYACIGSDGFYSSSDDGKHWQHLNSGGIENKSISTMTASATSLILAEGAGVIRSNDNGFSWSESTGDIAVQAVHAFAIKGAMIIAGTDAGVFVSTDDGISWSRSSSGMQSNDAVSALTVSGNAIFAGTSDFNIDYNSTSGIYRSLDNGATWQLVNNGLPNLSLYSLFADGSRIYSGTFLGISYSDNNGDLWQTASDSLPKPAVNALTSVWTTAFVGTVGSYIFQTNDQGNHWEISKKGLTRPNVNALLSVGNTLFAGTDATPKEKKGGLHRSTDYGASWTQLTKGIPIMSVSSLVEFNTSIYTSGDSGIFSSTDNGSTWKKFSLLIPSVTFIDSSGYYAFYKFSDSLWRYTVNSGWLPVNIGLLSANIQAIARKDTNLYLGTDSGIYRLSDKEIGSSLVTSDILNVQCLWTNDLLIAAGTKTGIYISSDDGKTWLFQQSAGIVVVNALSSTRFDLYAGTNNGTITASLIGFAVGTSQENKPLSLQVTNPSASHAIIRYSIKQEADASLILYDILGNERARIFQDRRDADNYNIDWNTSLIPSGIYILRLSAGGNQTSAMMNVLH
jgi:photosystem II stability/assembly factor-like uncharacterized protein